MVIAPQFVIGHIGKTGGDAVKAIISELHLPNVEIVPIAKPQKHNPPNRKDKDLILTIRRLPSRELSVFYHFKNYDKMPTPHEGKDIGQWIIENQIKLEVYAENELKKHTKNGKSPVQYYIRSEHLRDDLANVLSNYYDLTDEQREIISKAKTKPTMTYCRDLNYYFTDDMIKALYDSSPLWSEAEKIAYKV